MCLEQADVSTWQRLSESLKAGHDAAVLRSSAMQCMLTSLAYVQQKVHNVVTRPPWCWSLIASSVSLDEMKEHDACEAGVPFNIAQLIKIGHSIQDTSSP